MLDPYSVVADPSRRRILDRLLQSDASVTELVNDLGFSQPLVSKHLRILRESGLVRFKADAQRPFIPWTANRFGRLMHGSALTGVRGIIMWTN